ncbi:unnamed protein product [Sphagnum troendelagicum]|uniref:Protein kinase domain-containing protein n=1 Tax=Sphagnum troendelagicum TaxID=128251 RepID=A0ABP0TKD5_9BRYO
MKCSWKLCFLFLCLSALFSSSAAVTNPRDVSALNALQQSFGVGDLNWPSSTDPCSAPWPGVFCDSSNTNVKMLILSSMSLSGVLSEEIGSLSDLQDLELSFNPNLGGTLPTQLGYLSQLQTLSMQSCSFTGPIPASLSNLTNLTFLALNGNQLTGSIPPGMGQLSKLVWFDLSVNYISGPLPISNATQPGLDQMKSAQHFHFNNNSLSGVIPPELGGTPGGPLLTNLLHLLLDSNAFTGTIPDTLGNLKALQILSLSNNQLVGPIPSNLTNISSQNGTLQQLRVSNNQLNGTIPDLSSLFSLTIVDFSNNPYAQQPYPAWLNQTTLLETIIMENCNLFDQLPPDVLGYPNLEVLRLANNQLNGSLTIPALIGQNITLVSLQNNSIMNVDQVSANGNYSGVQFEFADNPICGPNALTKPLPSQCSNITNGLVTWTSPLFGQNTCLNASCPSGQTLNLQNCSCADPLFVLFLIRQPSFSIITDDLMAQLQQLLYVGLNLHPQQVWITNATFTNDEQVNVTILFFPFNSATSLDQTTVTNITSRLSQHNITFTSPFALYSVIFGNGLIPGSSSSSSLPKGAVIGIILGGVVVVLLLVALTIYIVFLRQRAKKLEEMSKPFASWGGGGGDNGEAPKLKGARRFFLAELKKATDNFSNSNEIGAGGYGKVYKGTLLTGELVVVKRAKEGSMQGAQEFKTEIEILSRVHHRNLVSLIGFCYEQGEQMLVYEFMVNGTLHEWLLGKMNEPLDWHRRLQIALGSARGLTYLHENIDPPIIHRDVKSANILLDDKLTAKVADFGLSKLAPGADENQQQMSTQVKGTLGYLDPQYYTMQQLSDRSDVYSFGVVLLEILSGRQPIERGKYIVREVRTALDKGGLAAVRSLIDPSLADVPMQNIEPLLDLALTCVEEKANDRPSMNEAVKELEAIAAQNHLDPATLSRKHEYVYSNTDVSSKGDDPSFQYSGVYAARAVEPK